MFESGIQCIKEIVDEDTRIIVVHCYFFFLLYEIEFHY